MKLCIDRVFLLVAAVIVNVGRHGGEGVISLLTYERLFGTLKNQVLSNTKHLVTKLLLLVFVQLQLYCGFR